MYSVSCNYFAKKINQLRHMPTKNKASDNFARLVTFFLSFASFYFFLFLQQLASDFMQARMLLPVYLPAGVAFVAILAGGITGALGVFCALLSNYIIQNPLVYWPIIFGLIAFSILMQLLVIKVSLHLLSIGQTLVNLTYLKLVVLVLIFSLSHSLTHHFNLVLIKDHERGWAESMITVSTFLGISCVLLLLWSMKKLRRYLTQKNKFFFL